MPSDRHIEDGFKPTTPTEILLLNRIAELRRMLWYGFDRTSMMEPVDPNSTVLELKDRRLTLEMACEGAIDIEPLGLKIEARTRGPSSFGFAHFIDQRQISQLTPALESSMLVDIAQIVLRQTARVLEDQREKAA